MSTVVLSNEELADYAKDRWILDCPRIRLSRTGDLSASVHEGSGFVHQSDGGRLRLKLYVRESERQRSRLIGTGVQLGQIIPDADYCEFEATDLRGRQWRSPRVQVSTTSGHGQVVIADLQELTATSQLERDVMAARGEMRFFGDLTVPPNQVTETRTIVGTRSAERSFNRNVAQVTACDLTMRFSNDDGGLALTLESGGPLFPASWELRVCEALQFILAKECQWSMLHAVERGREIVRIRSRTSPESRRPFLPPIQLSRLDYTRQMWELFERYLSYVLPTPGDLLHPASASLRGVIASRAASFEAQTLTLAVAAEGIAMVLYSEHAKPEEAELRELNVANTCIKTSSLSPRMRKRLEGAISSWMRPNALRVFRVLSEAGVLCDRSVKDWQLLRNRAAHASWEESPDYQEWLDRYHAVVVLLYKVVFNRIGYSGKYSNYGERNFPMSDFVAVTL